MSTGAYRLSAAVGGTLLRGLGIRTRWEGLEHVAGSGPVLLAATHVSYPDFVFIGQAALQRDRHVRFMARHDAWGHPVAGRALSAMQHIPVDRRAPAAAYLRARRMLREGEAVCVFPEAGISYSYTVRPLMRGVAALASETGVPVVPVAIWGSQRIYSVGRPVAGREPGPDWTRGRQVDVHFGEPMAVASGEDLSAWTHRLGGRLTEMLEALQLRPEHRPRPGEYAPWYPHHLGGQAPDRLEALTLDEVPRSAVLPSWGPSPDVWSGEPERRFDRR
ncbi:lysophospholipid acyltransferase family protein [Nocardioides pacificus]